MIRVVITGPPSGTGYSPYKIESWAHGRPQFVGLSKEPLLDACRQLQQAGVMNDTVVGLFDEGADKDEWRMRTTVGYGARYGNAAPQAPEAVDALKSEAGGGVPGRPENEPTGRAPPKEEHMGPYREFPGGPLKNAPDAPMAVVTTPASAVQPATPSAPRSPLHKRPEPPTDRGPAVATPATSAKLHPKRQPTGSGGRRGRR